MELNSINFDNFTEFNSINIKKTIEKISSTISDYFQNNSIYFQNLQNFEYCDMGCANGINTVEIFKLFYNLYNKINTKGNFILTMSDLISNEFKTTYDNFMNQIKTKENIYLQIAIGSFYKNILPPESKNIITCNTSIHWFEVEDNFYLNEDSIEPKFSSDEIIRKKVIQLAEKNYLDFLYNRSLELKENGLLIISGILNINNTPRDEFKIVFNSWKETCEKFKLEKLIKYMTVKIYIRSEEELLYPLSTVENKLNLELIQFEKCSSKYELNQSDILTLFMQPIINFNLRIILDKYYEKEYGVKIESNLRDEIINNYNEKLKRNYKDKYDKGMNSISMDTFSLVLKKVKSDINN